MPVLSRARHEQFALGVASGKSPTKAYEEAYPGSKGAAASGNALLKNPKISERVRELRPSAQEKAIQLSGIDKASWLKDLRELHILAREKEQFGAAIKAAEVIGKSLGYLEVDKADGEKPTKIAYGWVDSSEPQRAVAAPSETTADEQQRHRVQ